MSAQAKPKNRHEVVFTMTEESKAKADALLDRCGHTNLPLLMARGLALVKWVEDQIEQGRTVAGIVYGDDGVSAQELEERPELLTPPQRPVTAPVVASVATVVDSPASVAPAAIQPAPQPVQAAVSAPVTVNPKLVPREKKPLPVKTAAARSRGTNRRAEQLRAHLPNNDGPVKDFVWIRWKSEQEGRQPPILIGDNRALPGELSLDHLAQLEQMQTDARHGTHFLLTRDGFLAFYGFQPGKGWCYLEEGSMQLRKDEQCNAGLFAIYPVVMAIEYLQRLASPPRIAEIQSKGVAVNG